jgi:hypothetical protein
MPPWMVWILKILLTLRRSNSEDDRSEEDRSEDDTGQNSQYNIMRKCFRSS